MSPRLPLLLKRCMVPGSTTSGSTAAGPRAACMQCGKEWIAALMVAALQLPFQARGRTLGGPCRTAWKPSPRVPAGRPAAHAVGPGIPGPSPRLAAPSPLAKQSAQAHRSPPGASVFAFHGAPLYVAGRAVALCCCCSGGAGRAGALRCGLCRQGLPQRPHVPKGHAAALRRGGNSPSRDQRHTVGMLTLKSAATTGTRAPAPSGSLSKC